MAEKCEFVLEPKAVEFTGLIQSMTGKHQLWELWADFIALTAISCSQQLDFRKEREERYLVIASKYDSEEMNSFSRLFALVMDGYEQNREQDMLGSIYMKLNLGSHWTGQFFTPYSNGNEQKVIGEFTCDRIIDVDCDSIAPFDKSTGIYIGKQCCLSREELWKYTSGHCAMWR